MIFTLVQISRLTKAIEVTLQNTVDGNKNGELCAEKHL